LLSLEDVAKAMVKPQIFDDECIKSLLRKDNVYRVFLLRTVKVDGTPQGIPVTSFYCCRDYKSQQEKQIPKVYFEKAPVRF